jgi:hypothetical protein
MTTKNYEKTCARLVQEAAAVSYGTALRWVREHVAEHPESMPAAAARALSIVDRRAAVNK